jgi:Zn-dependent protease with chaperone function
VESNGTLYDGVSARAYAVTARAEDGALKLEADGGWSETVPGAVLSQLSDDKARVRIGRSDIEGWSLILEKPVEDGLAELLPRCQSYGRWIDRIGLIPALVAGGMITALAVATGYIAPHWLAPHLPMSWERKISGPIVGDFGKFRCRDAAGQRALEALVERVSPGATSGPDGVKVAALDVSEFNAAALPGGYIVVFKPAITETDSDALAGVLAHEIAHVRRRHVTAALIRELGIGAFIRLFAGDVGANAEQLVALSYTREDEAQADGDAIEMLKRANISPNPTASLFRRLEKDAPDYSAEFLQSHPLSGKRADRFAASFNANARYQPALNRQQSEALFEICGKPAEQK